jgi:DNA-binding protein Fis
MLTTSTHPVSGDKGASLRSYGGVDAKQQGRSAGGASVRFNQAALFVLDDVDRSCIKRLIGHRLALVEREFILQTLRHHRGNRTRAANLLGISIRSLRNKIRDYRDQGESVTPPKSSCSKRPVERTFTGLHH